MDIPPPRTRWWELAALGLCCLLFTAGWMLGRLGRDTSSEDESLSSLTGPLMAVPSLVTTARSGGVKSPGTDSDGRHCDSRTLQADVLALTVFCNVLYSRVHPTSSFLFVRVVNSEDQLLAKHSPSCHNEFLHQERAAPWCRLQVLWEVLHSWTEDVILYLDSDVVISNHAMSLVDWLRLVSTAPQGCTVAEFFHPTSPCVVLFASNAPWGDNLVNTGQSLLNRRKTELAAGFVQRWWHYS